MDNKTKLKSKLTLLKRIFYVLQLVLINNDVLQI